MEFSEKNDKIENLSNSLDKILKISILNFRSTLDLIIDYFFLGAEIFKFFHLLLIRLLSILKPPAKLMTPVVRNLSFRYGIIFLLIIFFFLLIARQPRKITKGIEKRKLEILCIFFINFIFFIERKLNSLSRFSPTLFLIAFISFPIYISLTEKNDASTSTLASIPGNSSEISKLQKLEVYSKKLDFWITWYITFSLFFTFALLLDLLAYFSISQNSEGCRLRAMVSVSHWISCDCPFDESLIFSIALNILLFIFSIFLVSKFYKHFLVLLANRIMGFLFLNEFGLQISETSLSAAEYFAHRILPFQFLKEFLIKIKFAFYAFAAFWFAVFLPTVFLKFLTFLIQAVYPFFATIRLMSNILQFFAHKEIESKYQIRQKGSLLKSMYHGVIKGERDNRICDQNKNNAQIDRLQVSCESWLRYFAYNLIFQNLSLIVFCILEKSSIGFPFLYLYRDWFPNTSIRFFFVVFLSYLSSWPVSEVSGFLSIFRHPVLFVCKITKNYQNTQISAVKIE
eukprot:GHVP01013033.1.p1 GENE.GHVP01013033.1~~GHVP01013033.1.p1  ORF type:complete len:521 (-),score=57.37 GHVP01013033.1:126-1661(-)